MSRIKLSKPDPVIFKTRMQVSVDHLNYGNHVGNHHFLTYAHEARLRWLQTMNLTEMRIQDSVGLIMSDSAIVYKSQLFWGDEFSIELGLADLTEVSFDILYHLIKPDKKTVAIVKTGMVFFDYDNQVIHKADPPILKRLQDSRL
jgi:acyl-CoA thioester hydrolase